ncbi:hypothetical protein M9Y10_028794 [Tritrichomonas musculus]|uniref:Death domain-containing protein n=1 Tax=Tritrichomonas musculus TaxID=1915356 RepID=A0ABR2KKH4_9EUKA
MCELINEAAQQIQNIISQNPSEKSGIYERLYSLCSILQFPSRVLPDGTPLNFSSVKNDKDMKNIVMNDENLSAMSSTTNLSEKAKGNTLSSEFSRRNANELERKRVSNRLNGFSIKDSIAWQEICKRFGPNLNQSELLSMAEIIGQQAGIKVDREAKRRKEVLIKWYEENIVIIRKMLPFFKLEDTEGNLLRGEDYQDEMNRNDFNDEENDIATDNNDESSINE